MTATSLDYDERAQEYSLQVQVNDTLHTDLVHVIVRVIDINDNTPMFDALQYEFNVTENQNASSPVGQVNATDLDSGLFGMIMYELSGIGSER